jgi:hypothetical protein
MNPTKDNQPPPVGRRPPPPVGRRPPHTDDEYQLTFLLDAPLPGGSQVVPEFAEHVLPLPPADAVRPTRP